MSQEKFLHGNYVVCEEILDTIQQNLAVFTSTLIIILC